MLAPKRCAIKRRRPNGRWIFSREPSLTPQTLKPFARHSTPCMLPVGGVSVDRAFIYSDWQRYDRHSRHHIPP